MIISASRRTDIPAFYSDWFLNRLREGSVLFSYPRNPGRLGSVRLSPEHVDCIVFWTKNPTPMLEKLQSLDAMGYCYYFTFTLTAYGPELEAHLPPKDALVDTFLRLSERLGPKRVDWRYDPVVIDEEHPVSWHLEQFGRYCHRLSAATERCILNFIKPYRHIGPRFRELDEPIILEAAAGFASIAGEYGIPLFNCTEERDLRGLGLHPCSCIDKAKIEELTGFPIKAKKDPGQPPTCKCIQSVDIGAYDTCGNGCGYCYAVVGKDRALRRMLEHDPASPMLTGHPTGTEMISDRTSPSLKEFQIKL